MDKHALWKWLILIALTAWSLALVVPFRSKVKLGLDLKGGTSFTVQINESEIEKQIREENKDNKDLTDVKVRNLVGTAVQHAQEQAVEIIRNRVDALGVAEPLIYPEKNNRVVVQIPGLKDADRDRAAKLIRGIGVEGLDVGLLRPGRAVEHEHIDRAAAPRACCRER